MLSGLGTFSASGKASGEAEEGSAGSPSTKGVYTALPPVPNLDISRASRTQSQDPTLPRLKLEATIASLLKQREALSRVLTGHPATDLSGAGSGGRKIKAAGSAGHSPSRPDQFSPPRHLPCYRGFQARRARGQ